MAVQNMKESKPMEVAPPMKRSWIRQAGVFKLTAIGTSKSNRLTVPAKLVVNAQDPLREHQLFVSPVEIGQNQGALPAKQLPPRDAQLTPLSLLEGAINATEVNQMPLKKSASSLLRLQKQHLH